MYALLVLVLSTLYLHSDDLVDFDYELDAYYTNVSAFISLDKDANITNATKYSEAQIYQELAQNMLHPNIFLVEAAINPMGLAGIYTRDKHEAFYNDAYVNQINVVRALTAGFEEPTSLSFFVGRMMVFKNKESDHIGKNRAYMGTLLSVGDHVIKDNILYKDYWYNVEFKLKGTRALDLSDLDWSFRAGATMHSNKNVADTVYIGARRSSLDFTQPTLSLIYNSDFNTMLAFTNDTLQLTEGRITIGKSFPVTWPAKVSVGLEIGYLYYSQEKYRGILKEEGIQNHQLIFHPNVKW